MCLHYNLVRRKDSQSRMTRNYLLSSYREPKVKKSAMNFLLIISFNVPVLSILLPSSKPILLAMDQKMRVVKLNERERVRESVWALVSLI